MALNIFHSLCGGQNSLHPPQTTTTFEEKGEPKRRRLTSLKALTLGQTGY